MLLSVTELREHVETGLEDTALARLLASADAEIERRYGALATQVETLPGGDKYLFLTRLAASITSIVETTSETATTLASDDYRLWQRRQLERLTTGTNPVDDVWGDRAVVTYVPVDDAEQRTAVLIQLCQLAVQYNALQAEATGAGDHSQTSLDYQRERERLFRSIAPMGGIFLA